MLPSLPRQSNALVLFCSAAIAWLITLALFFVMSQLINSSEQQVVSQPALSKVDVSRLRMDEPKQQQRQLPEKVMPTVPDIPVAEQSPYSIQLAKEPKIDALLLSEPVLDLQEFTIEQQHWTAPSASGAGDGRADYIGQADTGRKEIVPIATRRPNIPKIAYDNRINGWVLLAYTVGNNGRIKNIRVLDAEPRGIFEANAVAAVSSWRYGEYKGEEKHISQRVDFEWSMYSYNMVYH